MKRLGLRHFSLQKFGNHHVARLSSWWGPSGIVPMGSCKLAPTYGFGSPRSYRAWRPLAHTGGRRHSKEVPLSASDEKSSTCTVPIRTEHCTVLNLNFFWGFQDFRRLVLGCMDSYDSESRCILQHRSRTTSFTIFCTAQISTFQQQIVRDVR